MADIVYGLTDQGLVIKTLEVIRSETEGDLQAAFGPSIPLGNQTLLGIMNGIYAEREAIQWETDEDIYSSQDPDAATGQALVAVSAISGTLPLLPAPSSVFLYLTGDNGTTVDAGTIIATASTGSQFQTTEDVTLGGFASSWAPATAYTIGALIYTGGYNYYCTVSGTSTLAPTSTTGTFTDTGGAPIWQTIGPGTGVAINVTAQSVSNGPIVGAALDITKIVTPVGGLNGVINLLDAQLGRTQESDANFRIRRQAELAAAGSAPQDALRADLLEVTGITAASVFFNNADTTDVNGLPPHTVECLVRTQWANVPGVFTVPQDQVVIQTIFDSVAAGIGTHGTLSGTVIDGQGNANTVYFSRPTEYLIYVRVFLTKDPLVYPVDGDTQVANKIALWGQGQAAGRDVVPSAITAQVFQVPGVLDVTRVLVYTDVIGTATAWTTSTAYVATVGARSVVTNDGGRYYICTTGGTSGTSGPTGTGTGITDGTCVWSALSSVIPISARQLADYDTSRVTVTSVSGTP